MGDNRETVAQAMYGKSEDDLEIEEQRELKNLMKGEAPNESEAAREHDEAVRRDDVATDDAASHQQSSHSAMHEAPLHQQLSAAGAQSADDVRAHYPTESDQKVTTQGQCLTRRAQHEDSTCEIAEIQVVVLWRIAVCESVPEGTTQAVSDKKGA